MKDRYSNDSKQKGNRYLVKLGAYVWKRGNDSKGKGIRSLLKRGAMYERYLMVPQKGDIVLY